MASSPTHPLTAIAALVLLSGCSSGTSGPLPSPSATPTATGSPRALRGLELGADWRTYGGDAARSSNVPTGPDPSAPKVAWETALDGQVYASPLVVGGTVIAATENGSLYALSGRAGRVLWRRHLADPVKASALPCGNIDPLGITGTPVYDIATGLVFAVATQPGVRHVLYGVDARTGQVRLSRGVDVPGMQPATHLQRAALLLSGATVYIAYGGNYGDCGQYAGRVLGVPTTGTGALRSFTVPTRREAGIWGASGPARAPGRRPAGDDRQRRSARRRLGPQRFGPAVVPHAALLDGFAPRQWAQENSADADLGSMGPLLLPGASAALAAGKGGNVFLVDVAHLGGVGGQTASLSGCSAYGGGAVATSAADVFAYLPCDGGLSQVRVQGNRLVRGWHAEVVGSPLVVGSTVWVVEQGGTLYGLDTNTGRQRALLQVGPATRFAKPAVSGNALLLPTKGGITAVQLTSR